MNRKWSRFVMIAQRIMNATVNSITKVSPSQLLYGNMVTLDRNIFKSYKLKEDKTVHVYLKELLEVQQTLLHASQAYLAKNKDKKVNKYSGLIPTTYEVGDYVLVSYPDKKAPNKLDPKWYGPMQVVKVNRSLYYLLDLVSGTILERHSSFIKPFRYTDKNKITPFDIAMRDKQDYLVSKLVAHRLVSEVAGKNLKNSYEFKVRWLGYEASEDTWLPWSAVRELKAMDSYLVENKKLAKLIWETVVQDKQETD